MQTQEYDQFSKCDIAGEAKFTKNNDFWASQNLRVLLEHAPQDSSCALFRIVVNYFFRFTIIW